MTDRPVLFDVTRLLTRLGHSAPTGIDRVDLAYARHVLGRSGGEAVALTPWGARIMPREAANALLGELDERWREKAPAGSDPKLDAALRWLRGEIPTPPRPVSAKGRGLRLPPGLPGRRRTAVAFRWNRAEEAPKDAVYLHSSHIRLDRPELFDWLDRRPDIRPVFFVHDLIPIEFPEYGVAGEAARHRRRMATVAKHAAAVIVNSRVVGQDLERHLSAEGLRLPPIETAWLGVETPFREAGRTMQAGLRPYLVALSTIEARKNHLLLLQVWRDLARRAAMPGGEAANQGGEAAMPALVIVGRRGWEAEAATDFLDRCEAIRPHVLETSGLSSQGLAALLAGARSLVMPSFAEGYGIPVVEALSLGTRVIASDIPVHREIAGGRATLLDPLDGPGWREAVLSVCREDAPASPPADEGLPTWQTHFAILDRVLASL